MPELSLEETDITLPFEKNMDQQINNNKKKANEIFVPSNVFWSCYCFLWFVFFLFCIKQYHQKFKHNCNMDAVGNLISTFFSKTMAIYLECT